MAYHTHPFAPEGYIDLRRGEKIGDRFAALSDEFPGHFATFMGPYYPADQLKLHVILPITHTEKQGTDKTIVYGFYEGNAQCYAITIPNEKLAAFRNAALASWKQHRDLDVQTYDFLSDTYEVEGVEPKVFMDALRRKVAHQAMLMGENA